MTAIAGKIYPDRIEMASDSIETAGRFVAHGRQKIYKRENLLFGCSGRTDHACYFSNNLSSLKPPLTSRKILKWVKTLTEQMAEMYGMSDPDDSVFEILLTDGKRLFDVSGFDIKEVTDYSAIGSGWPFVITALDMGADPSEAVKRAIYRSRDCGGEVQVYSVSRYGTRNNSKTKKSRESIS